MAEKYSGSGYWAFQIGASIVLSLMGFAGAFFILTSDTDEPGQGVMLALIGIGFLVCAIWLITMFRSQSAQQRAVHAWVIMQMHTSGANGVEAMQVANAAQKDGLTAAQIVDLQARRPDVPYPGKIPTE